MDFGYTEEQTMIRDMARDFGQNEVAPVAAELEASSEFPWELTKRMAKLGFLGMTTPEEYGGIGIDTIAYCLAMEEIAKASTSLSMTVGLHNSLVSWPLRKFGSDQVKKDFLVPQCQGERYGCFALTEPGAGSDAANQRTTAEKKGNEYILNGTKTFITNGSVCDFALVFARTGKEAGSKGISAFVVDKNVSPYSVGTVEKKMALSASPTTELIFEDCHVPAANLLGKEGEGLKVALATLDVGRISLGTQALGVAEAAFEASVKYAQERSQFGRTLSKFQMIQQMVADMAMDLDAARLIIHRAAWMEDQHVPYIKESAMSKLYATEMATRVTHRAVQVHGGYGYIREYNVERYYRDARVFEIIEGTSEIQRIVIARELMGK